MFSQKNEIDDLISWAIVCFEKLIVNDGAVSANETKVVIL